LYIILKMPLVFEQVIDCKPPDVGIGRVCTSCTSPLFSSSSRICPVW
jgi:hypothetical protein